MTLMTLLTAGGDTLAIIKVTKVICVQIFGACALKGRTILAFHNWLRLLYLNFLQPRRRQQAEAFSGRRGVRKGALGDENCVITGHIK